MAASRFYAFLLSVPLLTSVSPAQTPVTFLQPESLGSCGALAAADFNGDGNLDVACASGALTSGTLTVWLGDGHGHFHQTPQTISTASTQIVAGDFNSDGYPDLVIAGSNSAGPNQIVLLPGRGDGTFGAPITIVQFASAYVTSLAAADLTLNGRLDLVAELVDGSGPAKVEAYLGNGDGTFQKAIDTGLAGETPYNFTNVAVADFNGDGIPDVAIMVIVAAQSQFAVVLGNGDGTFGPPSYTLIATEPLHFAVADFTGDGILDVAWSYDGTIYLLTGNGDGSFTPGTESVGTVTSVLLGVDLNGDGLSDLVMSGMGIALNQGGGVFAPATWYQNQLGGGGVAGDFRNLGRQDLVVAGDYYENTGDGAFHDPRSVYTGCGDCWYLTSGDFDSDGNLDAVAVGNDTVRIYLGNGTGSFTGYRQTSVPQPGKGTLVAAAPADFNGDGNLDLAVGSTSGEVLILLGNGHGTFGQRYKVYSGYEVNALAVADFNGDGMADLAIQTGEGLIVMCQSSPGVFTITAAIKGTYSTSLVVADFNHDGIPDLATAQDVYLGNGDGTFRQSYTLSQSGTYVQTGDFNGDGIPDLATSDAIDGVLAWLGVGDGTFGPPITVVPSTNPNLPLPVVADFNGDGFSDIVVTYNLAATATLYLGNANGAFTAQTLSNLPQLNQFPLSLGDFTNDGLIDLFFVNGAGQLMTLLNTTR